MSEDKGTTLLELANRLSVRYELVREFLESKGISAYLPDSKVTDQIVRMLEEEFKPEDSVMQRVTGGARRLLRKAAGSEKNLQQAALDVSAGGGGPAASDEEEDYFQAPQGEMSPATEEVESSSRPDESLPQEVDTLPPDPEVTPETESPPAELLPEDTLETVERPESDVRTPSAEPTSEDVEQEPPLDQLAEIEEMLKETSGSPDPPPVEEVETPSAAVEEISAPAAEPDRGEVGEQETATDPAEASGQDADQPDEDSDTGLNPDELDQLLKSMPSGRERETQAVEMEPARTAVPGEETVEDAEETSDLAKELEQDLDKLDEETDQTLGQDDLAELLESMSPAAETEAKQTEISPTAESEEAMAEEPETDSGLAREPVPSEGALDDADDADVSPDELDRLLNSMSSGPQAEPEVEVSPKEELQPPPIPPEAEGDDQTPGQALALDEEDMGDLEQALQNLDEPTDSKTEIPSPAASNAGEDDLALSDLLSDTPQEQGPVGEESKSEPEPGETQPPFVEERDGEGEAQRWLRRVVIAPIRSAVAQAKDAYSSLGQVPKMALTLVVGTAILAFLFGSLSYMAKHRAGRDLDLWETGQKLYEIEEFSLAAGQFSELVSYYPESEHFRKALYMVAECRYRQGEYALALSVFTKVRDILADRPQEMDGLLYPDFTMRGEGEFRIADCYVQLGRYSKAAELMEGIAEREPSSTVGRQAGLGLADVYLAWAEDEGNPPIFRQAIQQYTLQQLREPDETRGSEIAGRIGKACESLAQAEPENWRSHYETSLAHYEEARRMLTGSLSSGEKVGEIDISIGRVDEALEDWYAAEAAYRSAMEQQLGEGPAVKATLGLSRSLIRQREFEEVLPRLEQILNDSLEGDDLTDALFLRGDVAWELERYDETLAFYQTALERDLGERTSGDYGQLAHMRITNILFTQEKKYEEAAKRYEDIITRYPDGPYTHRAEFRLGESLFELGRYTDAAKEFNTAIRDYGRLQHRDPDLLEASYYMRAKARLMAGQKGKAMTALERALEDLGFPEDENGIWARLTLARLYADLNFFDKAVAAYREYLRSFPETDLDGNVAMELAAVQEDGLDYEAARGTYEEVMAFHPDRPVALEAQLALAANLASAAEQGSEEKGRDLSMRSLLAYERSLQRWPNDPRACLGIGRLRHREGDFSTALIYLDRYLNRVKEGSSWTQALFLAGDAFFQAGDYENSIEHLKQIPEDSLPASSESEARFKLAEAYRMRGQKREARTIYDKVATAFPSTDWGKAAGWQRDQMDWEKDLSQRIPVK